MTALPPISRRALLRGAGGTAAAGVAAFGLGGCGGATVSLGSNMFDPAPRTALRNAADAFTAESGAEVTIHTFEHTPFQVNIDSYLDNSRPDQVFTWFAGATMQRLVTEGWVAPLDTEFAGIPGLTPAIKQQASASDGHQYLIPSTTYPWAVHYRKSLFASRGYEVPTNYDEFVTLCKQMKADQLTPLAWGTIDGWQLLGLFSILNLRINGPEFHRRLLDGEEGFDTPFIARVLDHYRELLPFHMPDSRLRPWQDAAQALRDRRAGMYYMGTFMANQFAKGAEQADLGIFPFPAIDPTIGASAIEAPVDGFMLTTRGGKSDQARALVRQLGQAAAADQLVQSDPSVIAVNTRANRSGYKDLQTQAYKMVNQASDTFSFIDREMDFRFVIGTLQPQLLAFVRNVDEAPAIMRTIERARAGFYDKAA